MVVSHKHRSSSKEFFSLFYLANLCKMQVTMGSTVMLQNGVASRSVSRSAQAARISKGLRAPFLNGQQIVSRVAAKRPAQLSQVVHSKLQQRIPVVEKLESSELDLAVNAIRFLAIDGVNKANSGHPGLPMGCAPMAYLLWNEFMTHNPKDAKWFNRDRFVLSAGHGSMLLYSLLHFTGYNVTVSLSVLVIYRFIRLYYN